MVSLSTVFSSLSPRRNPFTMVSAPPRKVISKQETPSASPPTPPPVPQLPPNLNTSSLSPQPNLQPSPSPQTQTSPLPADSPDSPQEKFLADISDSDDDTDSDSDDDRRDSQPKFDYDARFRPLENLDLSIIPNPGPEAETCYTFENFGPESMRNWCLPDFVSSDVFATVKAGERVYFITEFNEFFWRECLPMLIVVVIFAERTSRLGTEHKQSWRCHCIQHRRRTRERG